MTFLALFFSLTLTAQAQIHRCEALFTPSVHAGRTTVLFDYVPEKVTREQKMEIQSVIQKVGALAGAELFAPSYVRLDLFEVTGHISWDSRERKITTALRPYVAGYKTAAHARVILAHEFGHAIFHTSLIELRPDHAIEKMRALYAQALERANGNPYDPEAWRIKWEAQMLLTPYDELFADVMAVMYAGDPNAISKSLRPTWSKTDPDYEDDVHQDLMDQTKARSFSRSSVKKFRNLELLEEDETVPSGVIPYVQLSQARVWLWKNHIGPNLANPAAQQAFVAKLFHALADEIEVMSVRRLRHEKMPTVTEMNQSLIRRLQKTL